MLERSCNLAQEGMEKYFWDNEKKYYEHHYPPMKEEKFIYWWHAHTVDALLDSYERTKDVKYMERIHRELTGTWKANGNTFLNNWYDDMEWMALALLRLWDMRKNEACKEQIYIIWEDVKTAWNDHMGGGLAWRKQQLDYKNTPANAPAAILAFRLYQRFGNKDDLLWGEKIFFWNYNNLVEKESGFVWDGVNRLGDGKIDYEWEFTYCQGVFLQAALEYYHITKEEKYLALAVQTAREAKRRLADEKGGFLPYEGKDDCGLFRGIFFRYCYELLKECPELKDIEELIQKHALQAAGKAVSEKGLIGGNWDQKAEGTIDLAQQLSGIMVMEMGLKLNPAH